MSQNMPQYPGRGTDLQSAPLPGDDPLALADTLKIVTCSICRAVYVPAEEQQMKSSAVLLETAFLEICHFCFRCQRPACPQCWNPIHHVCASCGEEARLPFCSPVPSLEGLAFLPGRTARAGVLSFVCQRNGRFYIPAQASSHPVSYPASPSPTVDAGEPAVAEVLPTLQQPDQSAPAASESYPIWLQEAFRQKTDGSSSLTPAVPLAQQGESAPTPLLATPVYAWPQTGQTNWPQMAPVPQQPVAPVALQALPAPTMQQPAAAVPAPIVESQREIQSQESSSDEEFSLLERVENILIVITSFLLLAVVLMIVLSISSAQVNAFFLHLLHIDIRAEIAYLLQLR